MRNTRVHTEFLIFDERYSRTTKNLVFQIFINSFNLKISHIRYFYFFFINMLFVFKFRVFAGIIEMLQRALFEPKLES